MVDLIPFTLYFSSLFIFSFFYILGVGKTWLLTRWSGEGQLMDTNSSLPTIGIDFKMKSMKLNGNLVKVQIVRKIILIFLANNIDFYYFSLSGTQRDKSDLGI